MERIRVVWSTGAGGTGLSTFYATNGQGPLVSNAVKAFFTSIGTYLPAPVTLTFATGGDVIDPTNGQLTGVWTGATAGTVSGDAAKTNYAAGTGAYVSWRTGTIVNGHRVQGRTFICPLANGSYDAQGTIDNSVVSAATTALGTLMTTVGTNLRIWHRPTASFSGGDHAVSSATFNDRVTSLRSRRS